MKEKTKSEIMLLEEINDKLEKLLIVSALAGMDKGAKIRFLKNYDGELSKRDLEKLTGIDRNSF